METKTITCDYHGPTAPAATVRFYIGKIERDACTTCAAAIAGVGTPLLRGSFAAIRENQIAIEAEQTKRVAEQKAAREKRRAESKVAAAEQGKARRAQLALLKGKR